MMLISFMLEMFHESLTQLPFSGSEESKEREVPAQLQSMTSTSKKKLRCRKLREALQEFVKLPLLVKVELDYVNCSSDPTRSWNDIICTILRDFASKFNQALSTRVPLSEVSDFGDVAINCAESLVWKPLQSSRENDGCLKGAARYDRERFRHELPNKLGSIAQDLLWLLEDASHEVPLFVDAEANPWTIWEIFVDAKVQKQRFCALAVYESVEQFTCGKTKLVENAMTTRLWNTMLSRFKSSELHLAEHEMIDSHLERELDAFRKILSDLRSRWEGWALPTIISNEECFCCESCTGCGKSLWGLREVWIVDVDRTKTLRTRQKRHQQFSAKDPFIPIYLRWQQIVDEHSSVGKPLDEDAVVRKRVKLFEPRQPSFEGLTQLMSDLAAAASNVVSALPVPKPSEDAESSQGSSPGSWLNVVNTTSSVASTSKEEHCTKLREALQKMSQVRVLVEVELAYGRCSRDTRSESDAIRPILKDFVSKFEATWPNDLNCLPLTQASDFEDVAINWAESLVWKPLRSRCEDDGCCKGVHDLCSIADDLLGLLEDASHEVPLFADAEANPWTIWEIFVAAKVQRQRFCTLAANEKHYRDGKKLVESSMTARLWNTMQSRFKTGQLHLAEHKMIDSDLESQLKDFRHILSNLRQALAGSSIVRLTNLMSDLAAAASKIANALPAPKPSEDAESSQESSPSSCVSTSHQADKDSFRPDESASEVGDGSGTSDSYTLLSAVGGLHCFLPCYLFKVPGQVEETSFISGKDTGSKNIIDHDEDVESRIIRY